MHEEGFKRQLIANASIQAGMRVLDLGCGTGTLTVMIKQAHPQAYITGLDGDLQVLTIARQKAAEAGVEIEFFHALADHLPFSNQHFERVLTSLVIHHLDREQKQAAFFEVYRVLQPGGELHLLDFGAPRSMYGHALSLVIAHLEETRENICGQLPGMIRSAGFDQVTENAFFSTLVGDLTAINAVK
jgi:ubiquinone/menaquinone biosynthesis C-methylase UbiE